MNGYAICSVINSIVFWLQSSLAFPVGLVAGAFFDGVFHALRQQTQPPESAIALGLNMAPGLFVAGIVALVWWFARRGSKSVYIAGVTLYMADTLVAVLLSDWISVGFHAFVLFMLLGGYSFMRERKKAEKALEQAEKTARQELETEPPLSR